MKPFAAAAVYVIAEAARRYTFKDAEIQDCITNALNGSGTDTQVGATHADAAINLVWKRRMGEGK